MLKLFVRTVVLSIVLTMLVPAAALAAPVTEYQLQYTPLLEGGVSQMIVTALVTPGSSLPTTVSIPVPSGSTLLWSGEILGADPAADPFREPTVETIGAMDVYSFLLQESLIGQVEVQLMPPSISGSRVSSLLTWTNVVDEALVSGSVIVEPGAERVTIEPAPTGDPQSNEDGERLYALPGERLATGGSYVMDVSWRRGGAASESALLPILVGALLIAVVALIIVIARERTRARRAHVARGRARADRAESPDPDEE